jgi:exonuclease III
MKCLTWNLEWASPTSKRLGIIRKKIEEADPDVVCYTETNRSTLPEQGFVIAADANYGYPNTGEKRKVILWSKCAWSECDVFGGAGLPSGRFISGVTGGIRFVGVCIPWRDAHVRTGRRDREPWEDHFSYCKELGDILERYSRSKVPICVLGDYNQRIPKGTQPQRAYDALIEAIPGQFDIVTKGILDPDGKSLIDHFAVSPELSAEGVEVLHRLTPDGTRLSDHVGVVTTLKINKANKAVDSTRYCA